MAGLTGLTLSGTVTLNVAADLTINGDVVVGTGTKLAMTGAKTLTATLLDVSGTLETSANAIVANAITLQAGARANVNSAMLTTRGRVRCLAASVINVASGASLKAEASLEIAGNLEGAGSVESSSSGSFTWSGGNLVAGGSLALKGSATLSAGSGSSCDRQMTITGMTTVAAAAQFSLAASGRFIVGSAGNVTHAAGSRVIDAVTSARAAAAYEIQAGAYVAMKGAVAARASIETAVANAGTFVVNGADCAVGTASKMYSQTSGSFYVDAGAKVSSSSNMTFAGGWLRGKGTIQASVRVRAGASVGPGASPGTMTVTGDYFMERGSTHQFEVGNTQTGWYDVLDVRGSLYLGGTLQVVKYGGCTCFTGESWQPIKYNRVYFNWDTRPNDVSIAYGVSIATFKYVKPGTAGAAAGAAPSVAVVALGALVAAAVALRA